MLSMFLFNNHVKMSMNNNIPHIALKAIRNLLSHFLQRIDDNSLNIIKCMMSSYFTSFIDNSSTFTINDAKVSPSGCL